MTLRMRLFVTGALVAVPLAAAYLVFDARQQLAAKQEELRLSLELEVVNGLRQRCEADPPREGRPGRGGSPEFRQRDLARRGRRGPGGPSGAFEYFAYNERGEPGARGAPALPASHEAGVVGTWWSSLVTGPAILMPLSESGPCAFVLARIPPRPGERRAQGEALLLVMLSVFAATWVAGGPVIGRLRRLEAATRRSAASQYDQPIPVEGHDELSLVAVAFNDAARQAHSLLEDLRARDRTLREYVANTTHDVAIPLSVLQGHLAELERRSTASPAEAAAIRGAMQEAHYMASLLRNLGAATKLDEGAGAAIRVQVDLCALVSRVVARHAALARTHGVSLDFSTPELATYLNTDPTLLEQALSNLVDNAVTYNRAGGHVAVVLDRGRGTYGVSVTDDGPGVPAEDLRRLTERWFRGSDARTRRPDGKGLGLAIAAESLKRLGLTLQFSAMSPSGLRADILIPDHEVAAARP